MTAYRCDAIVASLPCQARRLLFLLALWLFAGVLWLLIGPVPNDSSLSTARPTGRSGKASQEALLHWYGVANVSESRQAADLGLFAVIAGKRGAAVFKSSDGASKATRVGEEIRPGVRLVDVEPTQATIEERGVRQVIKLPQVGTSPDALARILTQSNDKAPAGALQKPISLSRGQLLAAMQKSDVSRWNVGFSVRAEGGIRIDTAQEQPLVRLLCLQDGDILRSVNGHPLNQIADYSLITHAFGQQTAVDIVLIRKGVLLTQRYQIQP